MSFTGITIKVTKCSSTRPLNINDKLQLLGETLGLFSIRDKDKSCFRIFITLLKMIGRDPQGLTSDEIAISTGLTRGTVVHHLNKLMDFGIVENNRGIYKITVDSMKELINKVRTDLNKTLDSLEIIGKSIDEQLNLK